MGAKIKNPLHLITAFDDYKVETSEEKIKFLEGRVTGLEIERNRWKERAEKHKRDLEALLQKVSPPSDKELAEMFEDWDMLSPTEQNLIRKIVILEKEIISLKSVSAETSKKLTWEEQFDELVKNPAFSKLLIQKVEFKRFCNQDENKGIRLEVLAKSFLFESAKELGAEEEREKKKREGLEVATGGKKELPSGEFSPEEEEYIRIHDPQRYQKLLREGKIKE